MAKQAGPFVFTGTVGDATGYKMNGKYFIKTKSEVSRRRIREHKNYALTRRNAKCFGEAVQLAKKVYHEIDRCDRDQYKVWYPMRNRAQELVRKEVLPEEIVCLLRKEFVLGRESSMVNGESETLKKESTEQAEKKKSKILPTQNNKAIINQLPDEILLGRIINPRVKLPSYHLTELKDQLAASLAFVNTVLNGKMEDKTSVYVKAGRLRVRR